MIMYRALIRIFTKTISSTTLVLVCFCQCACAVSSNVVSPSSTEKPWCIINPANSRRGNSFELYNNKIHVIAASYQIAAKKRLLNTAFQAISRKEAEQLIRNDEKIGSGKYLYLVRASAFYVDSNYDINSTLMIYVYPNEFALKILNTSLSQPDTNPKNLSIIVEVDYEIKEADVICLTAS